MNKRQGAFIDHWKAPQWDGSRPISGNRKSDIGIRGSLYKDFPANYWGKPRFSIEVECGATIGAADMPSGKSLDSKMYEKIGELLEEQLTQNCMEAISICIEDNHSDIFNFGRRLYQSQPTYWKQHEANWREEMDQAEYDVQVEVQLRRGGQEITGLQSDVNA